MHYINELNLNFYDFKYPYDLLIDIMNMNLNEIVITKKKYGRKITVHNFARLARLARETRDSREKLSARRDARRDTASARRDARRDRGLLLRDETRQTSFSSRVHPYKKRTNGFFDWSTRSHRRKSQITEVKHQSQNVILPFFVYA